MLGGYRAGYFPMPFDDRPGGEIGWWSPVRRGVLPLDGLRVSRSLRRSCRHFEIRVDTAFEEVRRRLRRPEPAARLDQRRHPRGVPRGCTSSAGSTPSRRGATAGWPEGCTASRSAGLFAGESMFHRETDASKVALVGLVDLLGDEHAGRRLVDVQWSTPHLASLGVVEIDRDDYLARLSDALAVPLPAAFG